MSSRVAMLMRNAPYGSVYPAEGFRAMLGVAVFQLDLCVVFLDSGVYNLVEGQNPSALDMKPLGEGFANLSEVGITEIYVHDESLAERGLTAEDLVMEGKVVSGNRIAEILDGCTSVLSF